MLERLSITMKTMTKKIVIMNEKRYAEDLLNGGHILGTPGQTMIILARYYLSLGMSEDDIIVCQQQYAHDNFPPTEYNLQFIDPEALKTTIQYAKGRSLLEYDGVSITQAEIDRIKSIDAEKAGKDAPAIQRLAFTLLVMAKWNMLKYKSNNGVVVVIPKIQKANSKQRGYRDTEIFSIANVGNATKIKRAQYERVLEDAGLLDCSLPDRFGAVFYNVLFIDGAGDEVLSVTDMRDLGLLWRKMNGANITRCEKCGRLIVQNKAGTKKYCDDCKQYQTKEARYIICVDCGKEISVPSMARTTIRCPECQKRHRQELDRERMRKYRDNAKKSTEAVNSAF